MRQTLTIASAIAAALAIWLHPADAVSAECRYEVVVSDAKASELTVYIACDGGLPAGFAIRNGATGWAGTMKLSDGSTVEADPDGWRIPAESRDNTAHYRLAVRAMAETTGRYMAAIKSGDSVFIKLDSWLAVPAPAEDYMLKISFVLPAGGDVAAALPGISNVYHIAAKDVSRGGDFAFGTFERVAVPLPAPGALAAATNDTTIADLLILGRPMTSKTKDLVRWVQLYGRAVAEFWGGFPIADPFIVIVPGPSTKVGRGRVITDGPVTTMIYVGYRMPPGALYEDEVLIHELLHLGSPYIRDTGAWLNEGIATFYEPIVQIRAGWKTREDVWHEWIERMPIGFLAMSTVGLEKAEAGGIYWGGALFLLLAEIQVRERTQLRRGIEDCLRAARDAGGTADVDWSNQQFFDFCDETLGGTTLNDLAARYMLPGEPPDLEALWTKLGVSMAPDGTIQFDDSAPLAAVRDAILDGGPDARWQPVPIAAP